MCCVALANERTDSHGPTPSSCCASPPSSSLGRSLQGAVTFLSFMAFGSVPLISFIVFSQLDGLGARGLFAVCTVFSGASHYTATLWDVSSIHVVCQIAQLPRSCSHSHLRCCDLHAGRGEGICSSVFATTMLPHSDVLNDYVTH